MLTCFTIFTRKVSFLDWSATGLGSKSSYSQKRGGSMERGLERGVVHPPLNKYIKI